MRSATTVLGIIRERGRRGLPLEDVYRQLYNRELYLAAYGRLYANKGALTPGVTGETVDGMTLAKIDALIAALRQERYRWTPVKRAYVPKRNGKLRPLGLPSWSDKLLGDVIRAILDAYYDPQFSEYSHGFRPGRGCHTALRTIQQGWHGTKWYIEGDLVACFERLDHRVLVTILAEKIRDRRFLHLIERMLQAGYLEDWQWHATLSGTPQGHGASPVLANCYLDRLDQFVETTLLPRYNRGKTRRRNAAHTSLREKAQRRRKRGAHAEARALIKQSRQLPSLDPHDPDYRRLRYIRYADDVRHITRRQIPFTERRGTEERTSGSTAYLAVKAKGDRSMPVKRNGSEDACGLVSQDPRDRVKAPLSEPQSPAMQAYILRSQRLKRSHHDRAAKSSSPEASAWWAVANDATQGDGQGTYVALDTSGTEGIWDRPTHREVQGDGAAIVLRGRESRLHGEGRQVL